MNKKQIMSAFLKEGILVPPEMWGEVNEKNYMEILELLKKGKRKKEAPQGKGKETKSTKNTDKSVFVEDIINYYEKKYNFLKNLLLKKMDAVSINKGKKLFSKTSIIGRVKDKTPKGVVVEDITGETEVITDNKNVREGDVVGLIGWFKEGVFFPEKIIWPDIPLTTEREETPDLLLAEKLTEKITKKEDSGELIITPGPETKKTTPSYINLSRKGIQLSVLFFRPRKPVTESEILGFLKRRELPCEDGVGVNTSCLIEKIPNIIWLAGNKENWNRNYKGIILISTNKESFYELKKNGEGRFGKI